MGETFAPRGSIVFDDERTAKEEEEQRVCGVSNFFALFFCFVFIDSGEITRERKREREREREQGKEHSKT